MLKSVKASASAATLLLFSAALFIGAPLVMLWAAILWAMNDARALAAAFLLCLAALHVRLG